MKTIQKYYPWIAFILAILLIFSASIAYYQYTSEQMRMHILMVFFLYGLSLFEIYRLGKHRKIIGVSKDIIILGCAILLYTTIPIFIAKFTGKVDSKFSYIYILVSNAVFSLCIIGVYYTLKLLHGHLAKLLLIILINIVFIINLVSVFILYATGFEIDANVLFHIDATSIKVAITEYGYALALVIIIMLPVIILFLRMTNKHKHETYSYGLATLSLLAIAINTMAMDFNHYKILKSIPALSLYLSSKDYFSNTYTRQRDSLKEISFNKSEKEFLLSLGIDPEETNYRIPIYPQQRKKRTNLITIYLESFQLNYTQAGSTIYNGLTPNLDKIAQQWTLFPNFFGSILPTINAMITSQCGVDTYLDPDFGIVPGHDTAVLLEKVGPEDFYGSKIYCLSDYLNQAGYYQVMMKGASMKFSGKGQFFQGHHYDELVGRKQFNLNNKYENKMNTWGLYDHDLFDEALNKILELRTQDKPYNVTLLTIDSHTPGYASPDCPIYKKDVSLLNGIHCTDRALGAFINNLEKNGVLKDTAVVIVGDHMMFPTPQMQKQLDKQTLNDWYGRVFLAIYSPDRSLESYQNVYGVTPDLAPTILDLLDIENSRFVNGKSLLGARQQYSHIVTPTFEIKDGIFHRDRRSDVWNSCDNDGLKKADLAEITTPLSECQRARVFAAIRKHVYK